MAFRRIALLEDDISLRDVLVDAIAELDPEIELLATASHAELVDVVARGSVHGVVADAWGPSHAVLADEEREAITSLARAVPVVLLTGRAWSAKASAAELSLVAILPKPFELEALADAVRRLVGLHGTGAAEEEPAGCAAPS